MLVTPYVRDDAGNAVPAQQFRHHVVVISVHADSPARQKLLKAVGHAAYLGCFFCCINGERHGAMRFLGYAAPVHVNKGVGCRRLADQGGQVCMVKDDEALHLTTKDQWERAEAFEEAVASAVKVDQVPPEASSIGVHGLSLLPDLLWYTDYNLLCVLPFGHMFFRGVFRSFLIAIVEGQRKKAKKQQQLGGSDEAEAEEGEGGDAGAGVGGVRQLAPLCLQPQLTLDRSTRARVRERGASFTCTHDFAHPIRCIDPHIKTFTIEELMRQLDCVLPLMFAEVSTQRMISACFHAFVLRSVWQAL